MTIYEKARELGIMLSETTQGKKLADAKYIFDGDKEAQKLFFEYRDIRGNYKEKVYSGEISDEDKRQFSEFTEKIQNNDVICSLLNAENEFAELLEAVFNIARATAEGDIDKPISRCTGSCSSCSGCGEY